jgi:hypothetical protein
MWVCHEVRSISHVSKTARQLDSGRAAMNQMSDPEVKSKVMRFGITTVIHGLSCAVRVTNPPRH